MNNPDMPIQVQEAGQESNDQLIPVFCEMYRELGESNDRIEAITARFVELLFSQCACKLFTVKSFKNNEILAIATLTKSLAISAGGKYGVLDILYSKKEFRRSNGDLNLKKDIRRFAYQNGWKRIDVAEPTDAWHRTVRFYKYQELRLTTPKFKHVVRLAGAA